MFNLFRKKKVLIHEPLEKQLEDLSQLDPLIAKEIMNGLDCDKLPNAKGEFGSIESPIPVNGPLGEIKYLGKLRGETRRALFFHRLRSLNSDLTPNSVDEFEVVCHDGTQWTKLYFDMYHPRRSNLVPPGYIIVPYSKKMQMDIPMAYGVNYFVSNFPYDLPREIEKFIGRPTRFATRTQELLSQYNFERPSYESKSSNKELEKSIFKKFNEELYEESLSQFESKYLGNKKTKAVEIALLIYRNNTFRYIDFFETRIFPKYPQLENKKASIYNEIDVGIIVCGLTAVRFHFNSIEFTEKVKDFIYEIESIRTHTEQDFNQVKSRIDIQHDYFLKSFYGRGLSLENLELTLLDMVGIAYEYSTDQSVMQNCRLLINSEYYEETLLRFKKPCEIEIQILSVFEAVLKLFLIALKSYEETKNELPDMIINNFKIDLMSMMNDLSEDSIDEYHVSKEDSRAKSNNQSVENTKNDPEITYKYYTENIINNILERVLEIERDILLNKKDRLLGFSCEYLFNTKYEVRFLIERFIFFKAYLEFENIHFLETASFLKNVVQFVHVEYNFDLNLAIEFVKNRKKFYLHELDMFKNFKNPHPGKIIWCLYHPSPILIGHELDSNFEENFLAGTILLNSILGVFVDELTKYRNMLN